MNEQKISDVVRKVRALRSIKTMNTSRSQNLLLQSLSDGELSEAAIRLEETE